MDNQRICCHSSWITKNMTAIRNWCRCLFISKKNMESSRTYHQKWIKRSRPSRRFVVLKLLTSFFSSSILQLLYYASISSKSLCRSWQESIQISSSILLNDDDPIQYDLNFWRTQVIRYKNQKKIMIRDSDHTENVIFGNDETRLLSCDRVQQNCKSKSLYPSSGNLCSCFFLFGWLISLCSYSFFRCVRSVQRQQTRQLLDPDTGRWC